ncbi:cytochrome P450 [Corynebacterium oculi]|uniref:Cytochrome P450 107B1 n=1 Tax=Corynebacterium oculi TaxID=1544416 RepID=A0A0Q0YBJ7_9CORY|nr:cytochrome P450 [Corynebacterium oculi]KQB83363.1 Cytochrome P450 107B1 [Corynebacterium oculi]
MNPLVTDIPNLDTPAPYIREWKGEDGLTRVQLPSGHEAISLSDYDQVKTLMLDRSASRSLCNVEGGPSFMPTNWAPEVLINLDAPIHGQVRRFVSHEFSARAISTLVPTIIGLTHQCLDTLQESSQPDLVTDVFRIVPAQVVCTMLGVSTDRATWMNNLGRIIQMAPRDNIEVIEESWTELYGWVQRLVKGEEHSSPGGLVDIYRKRSMQPEFHDISETLLAGTVMGIVLGGDNNVSTMLSKIVYTALAFPKFYGGIVSGEIPVEGFVEEILRLMPLGTPGSFPRELTQPLPIGERELSVGTIVYPYINAANRDPKVFERPLEINPFRPGKKHLQYGYGMHRCMGSALAQIELITIIGTIAERFPNLQLSLAPSDIPWDRGIGLRRPSRLPVFLG